MGLKILRFGAAQIVSLLKVWTCNKLKGREVQGWGKRAEISRCNISLEKGTQKP